MYDNWDNNHVTIVLKKKKKMINNNNRQRQHRIAALVVIGALWIWLIVPAHLPRLQFFMSPISAETITYTHIYVQCTSMHDVRELKKRFYSNNVANFNAHGSGGSR